MLMPQLYPDSMRSLQLISSRRWMDRQIYFPSAGWRLPLLSQKVSMHRIGKTVRTRVKGKRESERGPVTLEQSLSWLNSGKKGGQHQGDKRQNLHSFHWQVFSELKPVLLIAFDISLITFIYITSAPSRWLDCTSIWYSVRAQGKEWRVTGL